MKKSPLPRRSPLRSRSKLKTRGRRGSRLLSADKAWTKAVKERDDWTCQRCGRKFLPNGVGLDAAHLWGKQANPLLRHWLGNGLALCRTCHQKMHNSPREDWWEVLRAKLRRARAYGVEGVKA